MSNLWCMRICEKRESKMNNSVNEQWILCDAYEVYMVPYGMCQAEQSPKR